MKTMRLSMAAALLAACCATSFAAGQAEAPAAGHGPERAWWHGPQDPAGRGMEGRGAGAAEHPFGEMRGEMRDNMRGGMHGQMRDHMRFAGRLQMSEAQRDKLFAIHHAAAPQQREQRKAIRHAHEALRELASAAQFDEARANAAARELGQAIAAEAMLRTRMHAQMLAVLSPQQREQLRQRRAREQRRP